MSKLATKWKSGFDPKIILDKFSKIRTIEEGKVSFGAFEYNDYMAVLQSMIELGEDIPPDIGRGLISKGFHAAAKKKELKAAIILSEIKKVIREYNAKPEKNFILLTTINVINTNKLPILKINGCSLRFHKRLPKKYKKARSDAISLVSDWLIDKDDGFSFFVTAHCKGRNEYEAANKMMDSIDLLRGIWNLHLNKTMAITFGGRKEPINQIRLGALHTLHKKDGSKATETYWYEPAYCDSSKKNDFSKNSYKTLLFTKDVRKKLNKLCYRKDVESAIIRYARALDYQDYNVSLVKMWSLLEYLTSTLYCSYDKTINRTIFFYKDRQYNKQVLEHLRQYRNRSVHSGADMDDIDIQVYQLKSYVETLLRFHICNNFRFSSLSEAAKFSDLQPDIYELKKKISLFQSGVKFLGG